MLWEKNTHRLKYSVTLLVHPTFIPYIINMSHYSRPWRIGKRGETGSSSQNKYDDKNGSLCLNMYHLYSHSNIVVIF